MAIDPEQWQAGATALAAGAALGAFVPRLIAAVPEPEPDEQKPAPEAGSQADADLVASQQKVETPPKMRYTEVASRPGLLVRASVITAVVAGLCGLTIGWDWRLVSLVLLAPVGVALAVIDWHTTLLPTRIIAPSYVGLGVLVVAAAALTGDHEIAVGALIGWLVTFAVYFVLWFIYPRGMGYGDVRLSGLLGMALGQLGYPELLVGVYGAFVLGGFGGLLLSALRLVDRKRFPFGPFMLVAALVGVVSGPVVARSLGY